MKASFNAVIPAVGYALSSQIDDAMAYLGSVVVHVTSHAARHVVLFFATCPPCGCCNTTPTVDSLCHGAACRLSTREEVQEVVARHALWGKLTRFVTRGVP